MLCAVVSEYMKWHCGIYSRGRVRLGKLNNSAESDVSCWKFVISDKNREVLYFTAASGVDE